MEKKNGFPYGLVLLFLLVALLTSELVRNIRREMHDTSENALREELLKAQIEEARAKGNLYRMQVKHWNDAE